MSSVTSYLSAIAFFIPLPNAVAETLPIDRQVEEVVSYLVGTMDTSAQAATNSDVANVQMTTCRVTVENQDEAGIFLYQEQAVASNLSAPYRQRFLRIAPTDDDRVESLAFKPIEPENWIGLCDRAPEARAIAIADLDDPLCSVILQREGNFYRGETPAGGCPANFRGAVRITNTIILTETTMETWDRGFDAQGNQVWGADDESYQFRDFNEQ